VGVGKSASAISRDKKIREREIEREGGREGEENLKILI
jgi:hypothetical protein